MNENIRIRKAYYPSLVYSEKNFESGYTCGYGFYFGINYTVRIDSSSPWGERKHYSTHLDCRIDGISYSVVYERAFTERGLRLVCADLIKKAIQLSKKKS